MTAAEVSFSVLVVDDEEPARDELAFLLRSMPEVATVTQAADATECLGCLERDQIDVVFLDVRMPRLDGIDLARILKRSEPAPLIVFVTAFEEYAVEAFGVAAVDYLLKPVRPERLRMTMQRLVQLRRQARSDTRRRADQGEQGGEGPLDDRLAVIAGGRIVLLDVRDIRIASVEQERVVVRTAQGTFVARQTLNELEQRLRGHAFMRVHRRHLVNLNHVLSIESFFSGTYLLKVRDIPDVAVPVSRRHAAGLRAAIRL